MTQVLLLAANKLLRAINPVDPTDSLSEHIKDQSVQVGSQKVLVYGSNMLNSVFVASYSKSGTFFYSTPPYQDQNSKEFERPNVLVPLPYNSPLHRHNLYELTYVAKGDFSYIISGNEVTIHEGEFILMDTNCIHFDKNRVADVLLIYITFSIPSFISFVSEIRKDNVFSQLILSTKDHKQKHVIFRSKDNNLVDKSESLLANIIAESAEKGFQYDNVINSLSFRLLLHLDSHYSSSLYSLSGYMHQDHILIDLDRYIEDNLQTITLNNCNCSVVHS